MTMWAVLAGSAMVGFGPPLLAFMRSRVAVGISDVCMEISSWLLVRQRPLFPMIADSRAEGRWRGGRGFVALGLRGRVNVISLLQQVLSPEPDIPGPVGRLPVDRRVHQMVRVVLEQIVGIPVES